MASSEEEDENLPSSVENYYFQDDKEEPISFSVLPVQWARDKGTSGDHPKIFLLGAVDNKLRKIFKQVIAWRFDLSNVNPQISVLSKDKTWIKLETPRKSYEETIRSILVTVQCLHFFARNPESSGKSLWDHVSKKCSSFEVRPSENDLVEHIPLIGEALKRDDALSKSKFLIGFLENPGKRRLHDEEVKTKSMGQFIVSDSDDDIMDDGEDGDDDDDGLFDSTCALCDNGGDITCCEGSCLRSFHATPDAEPDCTTLGLTHEELDATPQFLCKNCKLKQHQCFVCGKLGSSDKDSGAEVFRCVSATCGYFFHPRCVARMIHTDNKASAEDLEKTIAEGKSFTCPAHRCCVCKQGENKKDHQLQFAVCRRCPKAYHRKCLPKKIAFDGDEDEEEIRAWENLLPNRILIYCLKHEIDKDLKTPSRDHIVFPGNEEKKSTFVKKKTITEEMRRPKPTSNLLGERMKIQRKRALLLEPSRQERKPSDFKQTLKPSSDKKVDMSKSSGKFGSGSSLSRKVKGNGEGKIEKKSKKSLGNRLYELNCKDSERGEENISDGELNKTSSFELDADSKQRLLNLILEVDSSVTMENVKAKLKVPSTIGGSQKNFDEKFITLGKVETQVNAVREALRMIENGASVQDALVVCGEEHLRNMKHWRNKFKLYLAPFFHGMRYTSFGRHFTKRDKLEEIANRLRWYVQNGDTVVDFCCGSNDFSIIMEKKLAEAGKKCFFKNYDLMPTKNDFNFEMKDWMTVRSNNLPNGSNLIIGLNPPFGVNGGLANLFIDKALEFKPKLLILIVPLETERLDVKENPYDLIWRDDTMLTGKSFYLPGSVNAMDKTMEQWNNSPPPLSLWSRPDWTARHKSIAENKGHISNGRDEIRYRDHSEPTSPDRPPRDGDDDLALALVGNDHCTPTDAMEEDDPPIPADDIRESSPSSDGGDGNKPPPPLPLPQSSSGSESTRRRLRARQKKREWKRTMKEQSRFGGPGPRPRPVNEFRSLGKAQPRDHEPYVPSSPTPIHGPRHYGYDDETYRNYPVLPAAGPATAAGDYGLGSFRSDSQYDQDYHHHRHQHQYAVPQPQPIRSYAPISSAYASASPTTYDVLPGTMRRMGRLDELPRSSVSGFGSEPMSIVRERLYDTRPTHFDYLGPPPPARPTPQMDYGHGSYPFSGSGSGSGSAGGWLDHPHGF